MSEASTRWSAALAQYEGTLILSANDVYSSGPSRKRCAYQRRKLTPYAGDYDYYLDKVAGTSARAPRSRAERAQKLAACGGSPAGEAPARKRLGCARPVSSRRGGGGGPEGRSEDQTRPREKACAIGNAVLKLEGRLKNSPRSWKNLRVRTPRGGHATESRAPGHHDRYGAADR